jgi:hypothetical protein
VQRKEPGDHRDSAHRGIGVSRGVKLSQEGIAIHDFPRGSEPLISVGTRVKEPGSHRGSAHRRFGVSRDKELVQVEIAI